MATESPSSVRKVVVHLRATEGAPILKQSKFKIPRTDKFAKVIDFLRRQLHSDSLVLTNDKFVSVEHRVLTNNTKPRGSIVSFFSTFIRPNSTVYGPIKKLLSEENPPKYRDFTIPEYSSLYLKKGLVKVVYSVLMDDQLQFPWSI